MYPSQTCSTNTFSGSYMHQISLYEISLLEGVVAVYAKAASTKPQRKKVSEGATGSRREGGSLSESIYLWYGDDSFPPSSQQTERFLPFECT